METAARRRRRPEMVVGRGHGAAVAAAGAVIAVLIELIVEFAPNESRTTVGPRDAVPLGEGTLGAR